MTFNVKGLPFPVAIGRTAALDRIGARLAGLRRRAAQPDIILLQEAFVPQAKAIARQAGYAYTATGPESANVRTGPPSGLPTAFAESASWTKGETEGKWADSGLVIMSDFPIVAVRKMAFPADMCAGFDCLAAKGVLIAWVKLPGIDRPVAIADTHLNSRKASGVALERANEAFEMQLAAARAFVRTAVSADSALVVGGDFNVGHDPERIAATRQDGGFVAGAQEATDLIGTPHFHSSHDPDVMAVITRAKDKQYFRPGDASKMELVSLEVPFGLENGAASLSDHLGFVARYSMR